MNKQSTSKLSSHYNKNAKTILYILNNGVFPCDDTVTIKGVQYSITWTNHAKLRVNYRNKVNDVVFNLYIKDVLKGIARKMPSFLNEDGYVTIRDFVTESFMVLHIKETHEIHVITCGNVSDMYPTIGDMVYQRDKNGSVQSYTWQFHKRENLVRAY